MKRALLYLAAAFAAGFGGGLGASVGLGLAERLSEDNGQTVCVEEAVEWL